MSIIVRSLTNVAGLKFRAQFGQAAIKVQTVRNILHKLSVGSKPSEDVHHGDVNPVVLKAFQTHESTRVIFDNHEKVDFKNIWLRDNCKCPQCVDSMTYQKILDTPALDLNIKPKHLVVSGNGDLIISWRENQKEHTSSFNSDWLYRFGQILIQENPESSDNNSSKPELWDRSKIWSKLPEISHKDVMETDVGLKKLLEMICTQGIAIIRNVPAVHGKSLDVLRRFAYAKETQYGVTFDVVNEPDPTAHLAYSGLHLPLHTDMNYRETSPGIQMLHCIKALDPKVSGSDPGGMSFFVDGFNAAKWLQENDPEAFHILTSIPIRFHVVNKGKYYSKSWPVICVDKKENITEIHYNNRTMGTLEAPSHKVVPFYRAYKLFTEKMRLPTSELRFHMVSGDMVLFNNRRILHARTSFDPTRVSRHLVGCYADIDEVTATYNSLS